MGVEKQSKFPPGINLYIDRSFLSHVSPGANIFPNFMGAVPHVEQRDTKKRQKVFRCEFQCRSKYNLISQLL